MNKLTYTNCRKWGNSILFRGYHNGRRISKREKFHPSLFVIDQKNKSKYSNLEGTPLKRMGFPSIKNAENFIKQYQNVDSFPIYGNERFVYQFLGERFPQDIDWNISEIRKGFIDIETTCEEGFPNPNNPIEEVILITIFCNDSYWTFGTGEYKTTDKSINYIQCHDEYDLLNTFISKWRELDFDVITGWNNRLFDIPYLVNRIRMVLGDGHENKLSPWGHIYEKNVFFMGKTHRIYDIYGISDLDYLKLYQKFTYVTRESYKLGHIAHVELGEGKINYEEFNNIREFYKSDWQKFVEYNIHDVRIVHQLEEKLKLVELCLTMAYDAKVNYEDVFSQVRTWDAIIYNHLYSNNIIIPLMKNKEKHSTYVGAYVKDPVLGMKDWIVSFDLNSLYPNLIRELDISPETLVTKDKLREMLKDCNS